MASNPSHRGNPPTTDTPAAGARRLPPKARPQDGELLDAFSACKFLGCSGSTLRRLLASGKLNGQVLGAYNRRYYKRTALEAYLGEHPPDRDTRRGPDGTSAHRTSRSGTDR
jgi:hypothetical protein